MASINDSKLIIRKNLFDSNKNTISLPGLMTTITIYLGCLLSLVISQCCIAQNNELVFNQMERPDGKPLGKIRNMTQDKYGYMWFSGESEKCVYRYDGSKLIIFTHDDANPDSFAGGAVNAVYADDAGFIWIGNGRTVDQYNPATGIFKHYSLRKNKSRDDKTPILKDHKGRIWVGTSSDGLYQLNEKTGELTSYHHVPTDQHSISNNNINIIYEDHQGVVWIGTGGYPWNNEGPDKGGLNRLEDDGTFTRFIHNGNDQQSLISNKVTSIYEDSRGVFWVGTDGDGLHTMDRKTGKFERHRYNPTRPDQLSGPAPRVNLPTNVNHIISFIIEDVRGTIWIGSPWAGINRYDPITKKITHLDSSTGFPDSMGAWNAFQSRDGVLWISTEGESRLLRLNPFFKNIPTTPTSDQASRFLEDTEGHLWVSTYEGGLIHYDDQQKLIKQFKNDPTDSNSFFDKRNISLALFQNKKDIIWVGTSEGAGTFNKVTQQFSKIPLDVKFSVPRKPIPNIYQDHEGILWLTAFGGGLIKYTTDHMVKQYLPDDDSTSISSDVMISVLEDHSGTIWSAGDGGINRLIKESDNFKHYLKGLHVTQLFIDSGGIIWACSDYGLYRYNSKQDKFLLFLDSPSPVHRLEIIGMAEDNHKSLWLSSSAGLIKLNPFNKEIFIYGNKFGIQNRSLQRNALFKTRQGQLLVGHDRGFYSFYPEDLNTPIQPVNILISDIIINNQPIKNNTEITFSKPVEEINELALKFNQNNIVINFSATDYRNPDATRYYTMLENYDDSWREAIGEKSSIFFHLTPGRYVFRMIAYTSEGTKSEKSLSIIIQPPWWQTWWAYAAYSILFMGVVWTTYRYQQQRIIRSEQEKARQKELAQAKEIEKAYTELKATQAQLIHSEKMASLGELTAGIAHEIQNPLNFVNNFSEVNAELIDELNQEAAKGNLKEIMELAKDIKDNEQKINHHGKRADAIVKGMLQHSRSSSGAKEPTDINALCDEYLRLSYHGLRAKDKSFNAKFETDFDSSLKKINIVQQDIGRVVLNLINNAFYTAYEKAKSQPSDYLPSILVSTKIVNHKIEIRVKDNGNGIPQNIVDKIFQPFFTTKPTGQGTGLGLSLSYDIVKAHGGEINVLSKEGEGSEFIIQLPSV